MASSTLATRELFPVNSQRFSVTSDMQKIELLQSFWPAVSHADNLQDHAKLFSFIDTTLYDLRSDHTRFAIRKFQDLFSMVDLVRTRQSSTKGDMLTELKTTTYSSSADSENDRILRSIELAVCIWLGINVDFTGADFGRITPRGFVTWNADQTLSTVAQSCLGLRTTHIDYMESEIGPEFSAAKLKTLCRVHIEWTDCLNDPIKLTGSRGNRTLHIYQNKRLLGCHTKQGSPFPPDLLAEVLQSLHLLFPWDQKSEHLCESSGTLALYQYRHDGACRIDDLDDFDYLKRRMLKLLKLYHGPPETLTQRLLDTRDWSQWATLWIGVPFILICTLVFGIISTVIGLTQTGLAKEANRIDPISYDLALLQACQDTPTSPQILERCN